MSEQKCRKVYVPVNLDVDAEGNILTSSTVYIPVTTNVVLKHIIPVAEGVVSNG